MTNPPFSLFLTLASLIESISYMEYIIQNRTNPPPATTYRFLGTIHMKNGGTSPTNMFESLATHLRQRFYPNGDRGKIDWLDVFPADVYVLMPFTIDSVVMKHVTAFIPTRNGTRPRKLFPKIGARSSPTPSPDLKPSAARLKEEQKRSRNTKSPQSKLR
jgi:hypothetical protein